uniref:Uncharacterized protein n=1 Tax=Calcidiscus leptoporus TaxID=127549 RepID=A0A7S0NTF9_9EUKA
MGLTCSILQGPETSPDVLSELHGAIDAQRPITVRLVNYTKAHEPFLNELTLMPLLDDSQRVTHFLGTLRRLDCASLQRRSSASAADMAVAAAWNAAAQPQPHIAAPSDWNALSAALGGQRRLREVDEAASAQSAPDASCSELLLSREAFPLDTLNNHPVAPVLLRMLQLNSSAGLQVAGGNKASPIVEEAGGNGDRSGSSHAALDFEGSRPARLLDSLPHSASSSNTASSSANASACAPAACAEHSALPELSSHLARGRVAQGLVQGGETSSHSSQASSFLGMSKASGSRDQKAFLAAVVGQGVIPLPRSSVGPPMPSKQSDLCGESSDGEFSYGYGSELALHSSFLFGADEGRGGAGAAGVEGDACASSSTALLTASSLTVGEEVEGAGVQQSSSSSQKAKAGRKRTCDAKQYGPDSQQGGGGGGDGGGSNGCDETVASGVAGSCSSSAEAKCSAFSMQRRGGGGGRKGKGGSSCASVRGGFSSDEVGQLQAASKPGGQRRRHAKEDVVLGHLGRAAEMDTPLPSVRGLAADEGEPLLEAMLRRSPSLAELPEMQELQQHTTFTADADAAPQRFDGDFGIGGGDVSKGCDAFGESETESYLQLDDVLQVLDSWDEFEHLPLPSASEADVRLPPPVPRAQLRRSPSSGLNWPADLQ